MRGISLAAVGRLCSVALSLSLVTVNLGAGMRFAFADSAPAQSATQAQSTSGAPTMTAADETPPAPPTVVDEVTSKRTDTSDTYLLSNGQYRTNISAAPINYAAPDGTEQPINTNLVPDPSDPGAVKSAATPVTSEFSDGLSGAPVSVSTPSWSASIDFLGAVEPDPLTLGQQAVYSNVATATDLSYEALSSGVKETMILHSAQAPSTYRFKVSLTGLELRTTPGGSPAAYLPGSSTEVLSLGSITVWDSSATGAVGEPAFCPNASATVDAVPGGAIVTYHIDPDWLADPSRVFPVKVDPTLTQMSGHDTFVKSASDSTNTAMGSLNYIRCGKADSTTGYNNSYIYFDVSSLASATVSAASVTLNCYQHYDPYNSTNKNVYLRAVSSDWDDGNTTWNHQPASGLPNLGTTAVSGTGNVTLNVGSPTVQGWITSPATNHGVVVLELQDGTEDQIMNWFYAREAGCSLSPQLSVTYTQNVPAAVTSGSAQVAGLDWFRQADSNGDQIPDTRDDVAAKGRGSVTVTWTPAAGAAGYGIYANDGAAWRKVGLSQGATSTSWSSSGAGIFPSDTQISQIATGANGLVRASSPCTASRETTFIAKSGSNADLGGAGLVVSDGTHLFVHRYASYSGPTSWVEVSSGLKDTSTAAGSFIATLGPSTPDAYTAFYLDGYIYSGVTQNNASAQLAGVWKGASADSTSTQLLSFSKPLLSRYYGSDLTAASSNDMLVASDGKYVYSASMSQGLNRGYDGWKIRIFDDHGNWINDLTVSGPSYWTDGFLVDGASAYFMEWTGTDSARITRASLADGRVTGQWKIDQGATQVIGGCFDPSNNVFWLGELAMGSGHATIHRFSGPGLDLRDNPNALYKKVSPGSLLSTSTSYLFKVVPYNQAGEAPTSTCATVAAQLPNRTLSALEDPRHTASSLTDALDHSASVAFDKGALVLDVDDLSVKSWGPDVSVSRHYDSSVTTSSIFTPGWRFNFERSVAASGSLVNYRDEAGDVHSFVSTQGAYYAPSGFYSTLTSDGAYWYLTDLDRTVQKFDVGTGRLLSETDANGNAVTCSWSSLTDLRSAVLTITAANGQSIVVTFDGSGDVAGASYATADGARQIAYNAVLSTVTRFPGVTGQDRTTSYGYDGSGHLASLAITSTSAAGLGTWGFAYNAQGRLATETLPGYSVSSTDLAEAISYSPTSSAATLTRWGTVYGVADTPINQTWTWNPTGTEASHTDAYSTGETPAWWQYAYAPGNESMIETSPVGALVHRTVDASGDTTFEWDQLGHLTSYLYDQYSQCVRQVDPRGDTVWRAYDANGNQLSEDKQLNDTDVAHTSYAYDSCGRRTQLSETISATQTAITDYSDFSVSGSPRTTIDESVVCTAGSPAVPITTSISLDAFGNVLSSTYSGVTSQRNAYSPATCQAQVDSTDSVGTVSHHKYDPYGREVESSTTASDGSFRDWSTRSFDALGRPSAEAVLSTAGVVDHTVTHSYDALGSETRTDSSDTSGAAVNVYDPRGGVTTSWAEGSDTSSMTASTRSTYDPCGRLLTQVDPGSVAGSTVTTYYANGLVKTSVRPDGSSVTYQYDEAGNAICAANSSEQGVSTSTCTFDLGGRKISQRDPSLTVATYAFDLAGNETSMSIQGATSSVVTYNTLGWQLNQTDASGVESFDSYDTNGRVTSETVGGRTTRTGYDPLGDVVSRTNPDGSVVTRTFDLLGRQVETSQLTSTGVQLGDTQCLYDTLSRLTDATETVCSGAHSIRIHSDYSSDPSRPSTTTAIRDDGVSTVSLRDSVGQEPTATSTFGSIPPVVRSLSAIDAGQRETSWSVLGRISGQVFDDAARVSVQSGPGLTGSGANYAYSTSSGQKVSEVLPLAFGNNTETDTYGYDGNSRVATWAASGVFGSASPTATYMYTPQSAPSRVTFSARAGGWQAGTTSFTYDSAGRLSAETTSGGTVRTFGNDPVTGERLSEKPSAMPTTTVYTWAGGHLAGVATPSSCATYSYDGDGQRLTSVVTTSSGAATTTVWAYDGLSLLSLSATASLNGSVTSTWTIDYLYDASGRPYAGYYRDCTTTTAFGVVTTDRGDVAELTDPGGAAFAVYRYDPWGNPLSAAATSTSLPATLAQAISARQPLRYAGYVYDCESGLYYCSARYYDPSTCQFISGDPSGIAGGFNSAGYADANPVSAVDPTGLSTNQVSPWSTEKQTGNCLVHALRDLSNYFYKRTHGDPWEGLDPNESASGATGESKYWETPRFLPSCGFSRYALTASYKVWGHPEWKARIWDQTRVTIPYTSSQPLDWDTLVGEIDAQRPILAAGNVDIPTQDSDVPDKLDAGHAWNIIGYRNDRYNDHMIVISTWGRQCRVSYPNIKRPLDQEWHGAVVKDPPNDPNGQWWQGIYRWGYSAWGLHT